MERRPERIVIRGRSGMWITGALAALGLYLLADAAVRGAWATVATALPWIVLAVSACAIALIRPCVIVTSDALTVVNVARTHVVPWTEIEGLHVRYQLIVMLTNGRRIAAWGSPTTERDRFSGPTTDRNTTQRRFLDVARVIELARDAVRPRGSSSTPSLRTRVAWGPLVVLLACLGSGLVVAGIV